MKARPGCREPTQGTARAGAGWGFCSREASGCGSWRHPTQPPPAAVQGLPGKGTPQAALVYGGLSSALCLALIAAYAACPGGFLGEASPRPPCGSGATTHLEKPAPLLLWAPSSRLSPLAWPTCC